MISIRFKSKIANQKGVTLIELLISMVVFLIGVAAIYSVTQLATVQKNTVNSRTDQLRSARIALEYIRRDTLNAGYGYHRTGGNIPDNSTNALFGAPNDSDTQRDLLTSIMSGNETNTNSLVLGGRTDVLTLISRDTSFNNGNLVTYTGAAASGSAVNVNTLTNACANCNLYDILLFESEAGTTQLVGTVTGKNSSSQIQLANGSADPFGFNQSATATGDARSLLVTTGGGGTIKRLNFVVYSVTNDGVLIRRKFGNRTGQPANQQVETRELVFGVSDFQIKYYLEDGTTVDDPSLGNSGRTNQIKMNNVVQIQISITLAPDATDSQPKVSSPIVLKEYVSTKNLRYEAS